MSDNVGYAMRMELPDWPLLSIHTNDADMISLKSSQFAAVSCNEPPAHRPWDSDHHVHSSNAMVLSKPAVTANDVHRSASGVHQIC